jgi:hypothetical protein
LSSDTACRVLNERSEYNIEYDMRYFFQPYGFQDMARRVPTNHAK